MRRQAQRQCRAHRDAADDCRTDAEIVGQRFDIFSKRRDRKPLDRPVAGIALAAAFERHAPCLRQIGKHVGDLRLIAAQPVLEDDGKAGADIPVGKVDAVAAEGRLSRVVALFQHGAQERADAGRLGLGQAMRDQGAVEPGGLQGGQ